MKRCPSTTRASAARTSTARRACSAGRRRSSSRTVCAACSASGVRKRSARSYERRTMTIAGTDITTTPSPPRAAAAGGKRPSVQAVVLAGGRGTRLAPYTSVLPKPLMPIGDRSILELVLGQLTESGIEKVTLCVGYLAHLIKAVIGDRSPDGLQIRYVHE